MAVSTAHGPAWESACRYQDVMVPVVLEPAARLLVAHAAIRAGDAVLDVGCGTGVAARMAAGQSGPGGRVVAIDLNAGMLELARTLPPARGAPVEWREGRAEATGLGDASFDVVLCAQTLQFVPDQPAAVREMRRVLKPGGRAAIACWAAMDQSPYFVALVDALARQFGREAVAGITAVFGLGDGARLQALLAGAGLRHARVATESFDLVLGELAAWIPRHLSATPLAAAFDRAPPEVRRAIVDNVSRALRCDGPCRSTLRTHIALGTAP